jgi:hypothetical protein
MSLEGVGRQQTAPCRGHNLLLQAQQQQQQRQQQLVVLQRVQHRPLAVLLLLLHMGTIVTVAMGAPQM